MFEKIKKMKLNKEKLAEFGNIIADFYHIAREKSNELVKKLISIDDSHEFKPILSEIEDEPVSPLGRYTFWIVISLFFITVFWLFIGQVDIVVSARGMVIPDGESKIIQPLETGVISNILVKEGDLVKKGQVLMEIDPSVTEPELKSIKRNLNEINLEIQRLEAQSKGEMFVPAASNSKDLQIQQRIYQASLNALEEQLSVKQTELAKIEDQIKSTMVQKKTNEDLLISFTDKRDRLEKVLDVIAYDEYQDAVNKVKTYSTEVSKLGYRQKELLSKKCQVLDEITYIKENYKVKNLEQLAQVQKQATQLQADADQILFKNAKQKIVSPCNGYVDKLFLHTIGGVVTPAQKLIAITPSEAALVVKATVLNQDVGFVKENMPVSIKIDTFSFQKYGLLDGEVKHISKNSIMDEKLGPVYEVYVTPITKTLMVEGKEEHMAPGMSLSAEIKVGKRRIIEFFIYPLIKYLDEGISVR